MVEDNISILGLVYYLFYTFHDLNVKLKCIHAKLNMCLDNVEGNRPGPTQYTQKEPFLKVIVTLSFCVGPGCSV